MQPWIDLVNETWRVQNETREEVQRHLETAGAAWQQPAVLQAQALLWERMWAVLEANMTLWSAWWPIGLVPPAPALSPLPVRHTDMATAATGDVAAPATARRSRRAAAATRARR